MFSRGHTETVSKTSRTISKGIMDPMGDNFLLKLSGEFLGLARILYGESEQAFVKIKIWLKDWC